MNKKILMFGILGLFTLGLVVAGYYAIFSTTFNVNNINGIGDYFNDIEGEYEFGDVISGDFIYLENDLENDRDLLITTSEHEDIDVEYKSTLELTKKDVDFNLDIWNVLDDKVQVEYTIVGEDFSAEVIEGEVSGYVLIYYADNDDRFKYPSQAVLVEDVSGNLPAVGDKNADSIDYSEEYTTSHGAKIWYIPSDAILIDGLDWSRASEFYFESKLIQYNSDGEITFYSGDSLKITPEFTPDKFAVGEYTIETTIA